MPLTPTAHPTPEKLLDYALGTLPKAQMAFIAGHLKECPECRQRVEALLPGTVCKPPSATAMSAARDVAALPADVPPKLARSQKYHILGKLGQGGMGTVYKAEQVRMARTVAIKVMSPDMVGDPEALRRFLAEARAAAQLQHPNIVLAHDADQEGDLHFLVMEYVEGISLDRLVQKNGPLPIHQACDLIRQAALGLQHAHEKGMVHRDIKPQNLMVTRLAQVKILDFGLARLPVEKRAQSDTTVANVFLGTPEYVAPEQARDARSADVRADLYSLGCTLYFLLAGRPPFQADTRLNLIVAHLQDVPRPLSELRAEVSGELWAVVAKMLAKDPVARFQTPREVAHALLPFSSAAQKSASGASPPVPPLPAQRPARRRRVEEETSPVAIPAEVARTTPPPSRDETPTTWADLPGEPEPQEQRRRLPNWPLAAALMLLLLVLLVGGATYSFSPRPDRGEDRTVKPDDQTKPGAVESLTNSIGMKFVLIPAGKFRMGSPKDEKDRSDDEGPQHEVEITRSFYLGVYEVTQEEYEKVMGRNPSHFSPDGAGKDKVKGLDTRRFPVECVSWEEAVEFCRKLSERPAEKEAGRVYRLPNEAEWEYSCRGRARSSEPFHFGASLSSTQANFHGNHPYGGAAVGPYLERTCAVGSYRSNGFGLYDLHGNVWEWCSDWYDRDYYATSPTKDPPGPAQGSDRVIRGGCWNSDGRIWRSAYRSRFTPANRYFNLGFRVALVPSGQ